VRYLELRPGSAVAHLVKCYWVFEHHYSATSWERVVPDGNVDFVIHAGQRPSLVLDGKEERKPSVFTGGHLVTGGRLRVSGDLKMFGVKFHAAAAPLIYPIPPVELNNRRVSLEDVLGPSVRDHFDALVNEVGGRNYPRVIALLEGLILRWERRPTAGTQLLARAIDGIQRTAGQWTLAGASQHFRLSQRYLQRVFQQQRGMGFKYFSRLVRVGAAIQRHAAAPHRSLTSLAFEAGYSDQSHQIKDFKAIVGCPPSQFFDERNHYVEQLNRAAIGGGA